MICVEVIAFLGDLTTRGSVAPNQVSSEGIYLLPEGGGVDRASVVLATHIGERLDRKIHTGNLGLCITSKREGYTLDIWIIDDMTCIDIFV